MTNEHNRLTTPPAPVPAAEGEIAEIREKLARAGWGDEQVERDISTGAWPEPHIRVTVWDKSKPLSDGGHPWAMGDGDTLDDAWKALLSNVKDGRYAYAAAHKRNAKPRRKR